MEFDESRPYAPGDDARNLDWRVTARTSRPHTKLFREERERPVLLAVDYRACMRFATRGLFKSVMAAHLAALLAWSAEQRGDRVGGCIFTESAVTESRPKRGRSVLLRWLLALVQQASTDGSADATPDSAKAIRSALSRLSFHARPGSLVYVLSDFRDMDASALTNLTRMARHSEVVLVFIHDPLEQHLPPGQSRFAYGARRLTLFADQNVREQYAAAFLQRKAALQQFALSHRIRFIECSTQDDPASVFRACKG